jgi:hypothetical protein
MFKSLSLMMLFHICLQYKPRPSAGTVFSAETCLKRKFILPRDDNGGMRGVDLSVLTLYNDVDNFELKNKYSENVKNKVKEIIRL